MQSGETTDISSGHVTLAFMRVRCRYNIAEADLAQREGDEFRFWVPRALNNVGPPFDPMFEQGISLSDLEVG